MLRERITGSVPLALLVILAISPANADDRVRGEITMRIITIPEAGPEAVVRNIPLPGSADNRDRSTSGREGAHRPAGATGSLEGSQRRDTGSSREGATSGHRNVDDGGNGK